MKKMVLENLEDSKAVIEYLNKMKNVYKNIEEYNPVIKYNVLIVFDDMTVDIISNKKLNQVVTELFVRGIKLNTSTAFIKQIYFPVPKDVRLNYTHLFIMNIPNKQKL